MKLQIASVSRQRHLWLSTLLIMLLSTPHAHAAPNVVLRHATELSLPRYQAELLRQDTLAEEFLFGQDHELWVLGKSALWRWDLDTRKLSRLKLPLGNSDSASLLTMASDDLSLYAATANAVFQIGIEDQRVFRFLPGRSLDTAAKGTTKVTKIFGAGDDFWWLNQNQLWRIDRYTKKLLATPVPDTLPKLRALSFAPDTRQLYWITDNQLFRQGPDWSKPAKLVFKTKKKLLDVQFRDGTVFLLTQFAALRLSRDGELLQSIPVEGQRRLARMSISEGQHAYLFHDQLLEVFNLGTRQAARYALPIDATAKFGRMLLKGAMLVLSVDGELRCFRLGSAPE